MLPSHRVLNVDCSLSNLHRELWSPVPFLLWSRIIIVFRPRQQCCRRLKTIKLHCLLSHVPCCVMLLLWVLRNCPHPWAHVTSSPVGHPSVMPDTLWACCPHHGHSYWHLALKLLITAVPDSWRCPSDRPRRSWLSNVRGDLSQLNLSDSDQASRWLEWKSFVHRHVTFSQRMLAADDDAKITLVCIGLFTTWCSLLHMVRMGHKRTWRLHLR